MLGKLCAKPVPHSMLCTHFAHTTLQAIKKPPWVGGSDVSAGLTCFAVGVTGFEPATSCSQSRRATKLRYTPLLFHFKGLGSLDPVVACLS